MVTTKELIEGNNVKRELLTKENEKYYSNLLMYIRSRLSISEHSTEEVLMEMLDHLLEGQEEGKTAKKIFGENPKEYADELIRQLPKEKKRDLFQFGTQIVINMLGWFLMIRGIVIVIISQFMEVDNSIYLYSDLALFGAILIGGVLGVWMILTTINKTVFGQKKSFWKLEVVVGLGGAALGAGAIAIGYFYQYQGPAFPFPWYWSIVIGGALWLISRVIKRKVEGK